jgi:hypothetical protein
VKLATELVCVFVHVLPPTPATVSRSFLVSVPFLANEKVGPTTITNTALPLSPAHHFDTTFLRPDLQTAPPAPHHQHHTPLPPHNTQHHHHHWQHHAEEEGEGDGDGGEE